MALFEARVAKSPNEGQVDLELLQFGLDGRCTAQRPLEVGMDEGLRTKEQKGFCEFSADQLLWPKG